MLKGKDVVIISSVEWDSLWQAAQEIASRLGRAGNRVLYIENVGVRSPGWGDKGRVMQRVRRWLGSLGNTGARQVGKNVFVCSPLVLPPFGPAWRRFLNRRLFLPLISRTARRLGFHEVLTWAFLPTDTVLDLMDVFHQRSGITVYNCAADFSLLTPHSGRLRECERELVLHSDLVFATCRQLAEHCAQWSDKVFVFPNGVSLEAFAEEHVSHDGGRPPGGGETVPHVDSRLAGLPRPIIGYVGGLHRFVDYNLLIAMARARPEWSWVFVGPIQTEIGELARLPNVRMIGQRPHHELKHFIRGFDVGIVPYGISPQTETVVPTKINEYLASGKTVVSTDLPTVREFNDLHHILFTADSRPETFLEAIHEALTSPTDGEVFERRRDVAKLSDWQSLLTAMSSLIEAHARAKQCAGLSGVTPKGNANGREG